VNSPPPPTQATVNGNKVTLIWAADAIPNGYQQASKHDHYTVVISNTVKSADGGELVGDRDFDFAASFGNVRAENLGNWRAVNPLDTATLQLNYTTTPTAAQAMVYDIRIDGGNAGRINPLDAAALQLSYTPAGATNYLIQAAPVCP